MKFKIQKSSFIEGLKAVQNIVNGKGLLQIMQNVLLSANGKELNLRTTDLDISICCKVECETIEAGGSTLPVKLLSNMITKLPDGEVTVDIDANDRATIKAGSVNYKLPGLSEMDFPKLPNNDDSIEYTVSAAVLKEMFRKTAYAASQDDTRRTLKGVLMSFNDSKLVMVATDGRRLAMVENEIDFPKDCSKNIVVPSKTVQELIRSLSTEGEVKIMSQASQICFSFGDIQIYSKLIDDKYPDYRQVIPKSNTKSITIDRQLLLDALDRTSIMTLDEGHSTKLVFSDGKLSVSSAANDKGEAKDEVPIKYAEDPIEILFNPSYMMDCLKVIDDDDVTIDLEDGQHPAIIRCSIPYIYVLMPLRSN